MSLRCLLPIVCLLSMLACHCGGEDGHEGDVLTGPTQHATLQLVAGGFSESALAEQVLRSNVVGYGSEGEHFPTVLDRFLAEQRPGEILIEIGHRLRTLPEVPSDQLGAQLATVLARETALVDSIMAAGGSVQLGILCSTPEWLATHPWPHDVLSGEDEVGNQPVWGCSVPRDLSIWRQIMRAVADHFAAHADHLRLNFSNEPDNYFAGDLDELLSWYVSSVRGVLDSPAGSRFAVGGLTPVGHQGAVLTKAYPAPGPDNTVVFTEQVLDRPLLQAWIEASGAQGLPLHHVSLHLFGNSPVPRETATWTAMHADVSGWLEAAGYAASEVEVVINDFPHWAPYESNDTEQMSAYMMSGLVAMLDHSLSTPGTVRMLQGFLMAWGFRPDGPAMAGFIGVPALVNEAGIAKSVYRANQLLTQMTGEVTRVASDDPFINAIAAVDDSGLSVLVTNHVPVEYEVDLKYGYYKNTPLLKNNFGGVRLVDTGMSLQQILADLFDTYFEGEDPDPQALLNEAFAEDSRIDANAMPWPDDLKLWCNEMQAFGRQSRIKRNSMTEVRLDLTGWAQGSYRVQHYIVDANHANPYGDRELLQERLVAAYNTGNVMAEVDAINAEYDGASGLVLDEVRSFNGADDPLVLEMRPNSVHLIRLVAAP